MKTVSIIVPVYNIQNHIARCIKSLIKQDYKQIEIILVNDGSLDKSGSICDEFAKIDPRIKVLHKRNGGVSSARNLGIKEAKGDYIMFVDGDDWIEHDSVSKLLNTINIYGTDACFCDRYYNDLTEIMLPFPFKEEVVDCSKVVISHLKFQFTASVCLAMINSKIVKRCYFNENIHILEDWEYIFRILTRLKQISICKYPLYHYMSVIGSASKSPLNKKKMSCFLIPDIIRQYIAENDLPYMRYTDCLEIRLLNHILVIAANNDKVDNIYNKQFRQIARKNLKKCLKSKNILLRQKLYTFMTSISPRLFYLAYKIKYSWKW